MFWIHAPHEHRKLERLYDEVAALIDGPDTCLFGRARAVSGWTPAQHLHHLAQINGGLFDWAFNAPQWMRFAQMHTRHHLRIVRDVLAALEKGGA